MSSNEGLLSFKRVIKADAVHDLIQQPTERPDVVKHILAN